MIELVTVELTNFRSFSHGVFEPLGVGQGMTAINGANGMGKSSVVHGIVWALYGITPDGVRVSALRRQDSEGDTEVKVTLRHDGQTIIVTRAIRGRNDTTVASIEVDGVEQTNVSSKTATNWIVNRFGLDAEAFLTAFVVRQKELDSLVRARPAERRKTIERLAGIERMSKALELARTDARVAQKSYDALPPIQDSQVLNSEKDQLAAEIAELVAEKTTLESKLAEDKNKLDLASNDFATAKKLSQSKTEIANKLSLEESRLADLDAKVAEASKLAELAVNSEALVAEQTEVDSKLSNIALVIEDARKSKEQFDRAHEKIEKLDSAIAALTVNKETIEEDLKNAPSMKELSNTGDTLRTELTSHEEKEATLIADKGAARGEWDRLKKAIDTLSAHSHEDSEHAKCPTCNTDILDVEILIASLNSSLLEVENKGKQINSNLVELQSQIADLKAAILENDNSLRRVNSFEEELSEINSELGDYVSQREELSETIDSLSANDIDINGLKEEEQELSARQKQLIAELAKLENAINAKKSLPDLKSALVEKMSHVEELSAELEETSNELEKYDIAELEETVNSLSAAYQAASDTVREASTNITILNNKLKTVDSALENIVLEEVRRKDLLAEVEAKTTAATTLDEFRRDRLARLTPELSEVASDFVSRMTDGKYTSVMLDEDFTPILTDASGAERPVAWLSGGEESAVALALRVAIGEVLAGQRGGLLVLDEALTAQDSSRRQSTMGAIRVLPRQVITINHVSEATDMVDLVAEIVVADDGGSTIQEMVPDNGKVDSVSDEMIDA